MNIFILDEDINKCAQYHNNRHTVKMLCEYVQMLSTTVRLSGIDAGYKVAHINHPCTKWVRESLSNYHYLRNLTIALHKEWQYRYDHTHNHKSFDVMLSLPAPDIVDNGITDFVQAMPDYCKCDNAIDAYRKYYIYEKQHIAQWKKREKPWWF